MLLMKIVNVGVMTNSEILQYRRSCSKVSPIDAVYTALQGKSIYAAVIRTNLVHTALSE
jgi:hypothetical protein